MSKPKVLGYAIENILHIPGLDEIAAYDKHLPDEALVGMNPEHERTFGNFTSPDELSSFTTDFNPEEKLRRLHFNRQLNPKHPLKAFK